MHVCDLPDDVLVLVFRAALPATKEQAADLKDGLGLLSVCRRWRQVALPMVYDVVFISSGAEYAPIRNEPAKVDIETMVDLVESVQCLHMVRRLVINVRYKKDPFPGFKAAITRLREVANEWAGVHKLEINLGTPHRYRPNSRYSGAGYDGVVDTVSSALVALIPGVREIKLDGNAQAKCTCMLFGRLVSHYFNQLHVLHTSHSFAQLDDRVFARLRDVRINGACRDVWEYQYPRIDPAAIKTLELSSFTANEMWTMFSAGVNGTTITFPRLANLSLGYADKHMSTPESLSGDLPWVVYFPAAKHVRFWCHDAELSSMEKYVFPARLESLDVSAGLGLLRAIDGANRTIAAASDYKGRRLASSDSITIPRELFACRQLTRLRLLAPISADEMIELVRRQPRLVSLDVNDLYLNDIQADLSISPCAEHEPVTPFNTRIEELSIAIQGGPDMSEQMAPMLKFLLIKIPTLTRFDGPHVSQQAMKDFVGKYVQWYPHLANTKLNMWCWQESI